MRVRRHILREKPSNRAVPTTDRAALSTAPTASPCRRHPVSAGTGAEYLGRTQTNRRSRTPRRPPDGVAKRDTPAATGGAFQTRSFKGWNFKCDPCRRVRFQICPRRKTRLGENPQANRDNPSRFRAPCLGSRLPLCVLFYGGGKIGKISAAFSFL